MTQSPEASVTSPDAETGGLSRLVGVLVAPAKTFASIGRKRGNDWLIPVAILMGVAILAGVLINPKLDTDTAIRQTMKRIEARQPLTDAQHERTEKMVTRQFEMAKGPLRFIGPVFVLIPLLFVPALYLGSAKAMGAAGKYLTIMAGYAYAQVPQIVKAVIAIGVAFPRDSIDFNDIEHIVRSNVGSFLDTETTSKSIMALMNSVDVFEIWGVVLCSMMLSRTTTLTKRAATITAVSVWLLWVLLKFCGAAIGSAFGG